MICKICENEFTPHWNSVKICSDECRAIQRKRSSVKAYEIRKMRMVDNTKKEFTEKLIKKYGIPKPKCSRIIGGFLSGL